MALHSNVLQATLMFRKYHYYRCFLHHRVPGTVELFECCCFYSAI